MILNAQEADAGNYTCDIAVGGANGQPLGQLFVCEFTVCNNYTDTMSTLVTNNKY